MEKIVEVEDVMVGGQVLRLKHEDIPIDQLELDPENPRIRYRLQHQKPGAEQEQELLGWPDVIKLRKDIEKSGGLRERIIVQWDARSKKYKVIEGNCRTVSIRHLHNKSPKDPKWQTVIAKVLPPDADGRAVAILLMDFHVVGKIQWKAHEKAAQVYLMHTDLKMTLDEIALYMRTSKTTVQRLLDAHKAMNERFLTMDGGAYEKKGEGAWSFFEEMYKSPELRAKAKAEPEFVDDFCRWVGDERLPAGADVRVLPKVLKDPVAMKRFTTGHVKTAFQDAKKLVEQNEPEIGSDFFKLLEKMRQACTDAAQVKEILKIRSDKTARQRLIDTYDALVGFMQLADVDPDEIAATKQKKSA
jgi:hypothetical protein